MDLKPALGDHTRRAQITSGDALFREWIRQMKRPPHSYLRVDATRPEADCLVEVFAFLEEGGEPGPGREAATNSAAMPREGPDARSA